MHRECTAILSKESCDRVDGEERELPRSSHADDAEDNFRTSTVQRRRPWEGNGVAQLSSLSHDAEIQQVFVLPWTIVKVDAQALVRSWAGFFLEGRKVFRVKSSAIFVY